MLDSCMSEGHLILPDKDTASIEDRPVLLQIAQAQPRCESFAGYRGAHAQSACFSQSNKVTA
jgi:hypothetical protein